MIKDFNAEHKQFGIQGSGTKLKVVENVTVTMTELNKIIDFDRGNLTITVQAGANVEQIRAEVEKDKQYLWVAGNGTVGGTIAANSSLLPPLRDQIIGMRILLSNGDVVQLGAKTMKNVAGYDAAKLLIGSLGTLGIILDVTFRLYPYAASEFTTQPAKSFVFKDIHKRIKQAFDPSGLVGMRATFMTYEDLKKPLKPPETKAATVEEELNTKIGDKFWT